MKQLAIHHLWRIDDYLVHCGLSASVANARKQILLGNVISENKKFLRSDEKVRDGTTISLKHLPKIYVSRGGDKLASVMAEISLPVLGLTFMDIGASTGGFTDYLLQHKAKRIIAIDVASGMLDYSLQSNSCVLNIEKTNIRLATYDSLLTAIQKAERKQKKSGFSLPVDAIVGDLSFISLRLVLPHLMHFIKPDGYACLLFKPQFEVARHAVPAGGVLTDNDVIQDSLNTFRNWLKTQQLICHNIVASTIKGTKGNQEYFIHIMKK